MRIMFFGDSNTWGYNPKNALRFENRFTKIIADCLSDDEVIEEGLCGRTLCQNDPFDSDRNGCLDIQRCIKTHLPLDLIVIMLGTNDAKRMYSTNVYSLEKGMSALLDKIFTPSLYKKGFAVPNVLIVYPPKMNPSYIHDAKTLANFGSEGFNMLENGHENIFSVAKAYDVDYLDTKVIAGVYDGIHLDESGHRTMADKLISKIRRMKNECVY